MAQATDQLADEIETLTLGEGGDRFAKSVELTFKTAVKNLKESLSAE